MKSTTTGKIAIEYDDWSVVNPAFASALEALEEYRENYPNFKVTMFTVPFEMRHGVLGHLTNPEFASKLEAMKTAYKQGWMKFAVHGLSHIPMEFGELKKDEARKRLIVAERIFNEADLPFLKIFKAPNWALSEEGEEAIKNMGYKVVKDGYYGWNLADQTPKITEFGDKMFVAHGHVQDGDGCNNGVCETMPQLRKLPADTEFYFLDEAI